MKTILVCWWGLLAAICPVEGQSQVPKINSDYWTATDALGRKTTDSREAGTSRKNKFVGIFYLTWHTDFLADFSPVMNIREILQKYPEAASSADHPAWKGIDGGVFWWDEPLFGYYRTTDEWVLRKHAELLADAGIDAVILDCTNGTLTWKSSYTKLLKVWDQARKDGVKTPRIAFILPFAPNDNSLSSIRELYNDLYKPGLYKDLWFTWKGKPLIMCYFEMLVDVKDDPAETRLRHEIKDFFTFRPGQPDYVNGPSRNDQWGWLENYPQHGYAKKQDGGFEQVTVGVAQNASDSSGGHWYAFNAPGTYGRSYTKANGQDTRPDAYLYGLNFQEQWNRAFELDPDFIWITEWNEWVAGRWLTLEMPTMPPHKPFGFIDLYSAEKSRDIEPVKSWGNKGDVYYLQMISNIRRFKGMEKQESPSEPKSFSMGKFEGWQDVKPAFRHYKGNTMARNHKGQGDSLVYVNSTGRNDIVLARVARDKKYVYFYVETAGNLTSPNDPKWMRLFIDIDRNKNGGWEGYDLVINRMNPGKSAVVEKSTNGWNWEKAGSADFSIHNNTMELRVRRDLFSIPGNKLDFEFKWSDNMQEDGNIMDFYVNGDAAPGGRFNFIYTERSP
ncbi:MAG: hypothetical protein WC865_02735 [Bacteroidales bacterium]